VRRGLAVALLPAAAGAVAFLAAEASVRILRPGLVMGPDPVGETFWRHDPELGWAHRPSRIGTFSRPEFSHGVSINSMGFRDREREPARQGFAAAGSKTFRIAVLGDSFTWGHGVEDEEVFTRLLEGLLPGVEVWNLGVSAYSTDQELLLLRRMAPVIRPDLVLVMISRNDFEGNLSRAAGAYAKPWFEEERPGLLPAGAPAPEPSVWKRAAFTIRRRSAFVNGVWWLLEGRVLEGGLSAESRPKQIRITLGLLDLLQRETARAGVRLALAFVPSVAHVYYGDIPEVQSVRTEAVEGWAGERGVAFLDLIPAFREAFAASGSMLHYNKDKHWNAAGHRLAATTLASLLRESDLLSASR